MLYPIQKSALCRAAALSGLIALIIPAGAAVAGVGQAVTVPLDQSRRVPFAGQADKVVNASDVIQVHILSPTDVRVVGKRLGTTNLIVVDANGTTLFDREISVSAGDGSVVTVYRGGQSTDYACSPYCSPTGTNSGVQAGGQGQGAPAANANPLAAAASVGQALTGGGR